MVSSADLLHAVKGVESSSICLDDPYRHTRVLVKQTGWHGYIEQFREVFIMRHFINVAVDSLLGSSTDELILLLANTMKVWLSMIDSSIDAHISKANGYYAVARVIQSTSTQIGLTKTLFFVVANDSLLNAYERGTLREFDYLALRVYCSQDYWHRFPAGYDLVQHLGNLFKIAYESCQGIFCLPTLQLFPAATGATPRISVEFARYLMLHNIFHQVSDPLLLGGNQANRLCDPSAIPLENDQEVNLRGIDLRLLWSKILLSPSSINDNEISSLLESLEAGAPVQQQAARIKAQQSWISSILDPTMTLANPTDFFPPEIIREAEVLTSSTTTYRISSKRARLQADMSKSLLELTTPFSSAQMVNLHHLPATLPLPRSLKPKEDVVQEDEALRNRELSAAESIAMAVKASSKDRESSTTATADTTEDNVITTLPLGAEKVLERGQAEDAKKALQEKYERLQAAVERRKAKAVWQIRRLKRIKKARKQLAGIYSNPNCPLFLYLSVEQQSISATPQESSDSNSKTTTALDIDEPRSSAKREKKSRPPKGSSSESMAAVLQAQPSAVTTGIAMDTKTMDTKTTDATTPSSSSTESNAVVTSSTSSLLPNSHSSVAEIPMITSVAEIPMITATTTESVVPISSPPESPSKKVLTNESPVSIATEFPPIPAYQPMIALESIQPEDNLIPPKTSKGVSETLIGRFRASLRVFGLEEAMVTEQFMQQLSSSLPVSLLLTALAHEVVDISTITPIQQAAIMQSLQLLSKSHESFSLDGVLHCILSHSVMPRYGGFVSYFQGLSLAIYAREMAQFNSANAALAKRMVLKHDLVTYLSAMQEFFLMSPSRCSSFLFDACIYLVEQAWGRITAAPVAYRRNNDQRGRPLLPQHQEEDLWSNLAFTEALRDASSRLHSRVHGLFRSARYYFQRHTSDADEDRYFRALSETHALWPLVANHRLHSLVIDFQVPSALRVFFSKHMLSLMSAFTRRYLEIGQLMAVYRIISIEMRRSPKLMDKRQQGARHLHLQLFHMLHVVQSFLRYFNDRHMTLTRRYFQGMQEQATDGLHRLLQLTQGYAADLHRASFYGTSTERGMQTLDFADFSLNSAVMLRICVDKILQEIRLFGVYILSYLRDDGQGGDEAEVMMADKKNIANMLACGGNIRMLRHHLGLLCEAIVEPEMKDHVRCLKYYLTT